MADPISGFFRNIVGGAAQAGGASDVNPAQYQTGTSGSPGGSFWQGADGNVWVSGSGGTNSAGTWDQNSASYWRNQGYDLIDDPNAGQPVSGDKTSNPTNYTGSSYSPTSTGSGSGSGTSYDADEVRALDQQKSLYERLLQSADSTLSSGLNSLNDSYNLNRNRANEDRTRQLGDLSYNRQQTEEGKTQSLNQVGDNSRVLRNSLMRLLGLSSGGGTAFDMADKAVAREATKNRSGVVENYGQNVRSLDRSEEEAKTTFERLLEDLTRQKSEREQSLRAGVNEQRQSLYGTLADLSADRARLMDGDQFAAADPYRNKYLGLQDTIDGLSDRFRTQVDYNKPNFEAPSLRDYVVNRAGIGGQAPGPQQSYSPYANFLQRDREEERIA